ncbi:MAG: hypothetical protein LBT50_07155 [Prevotellaceae bacterium]|jgi:hypothetical protein|nr:hypothetical protein [Prevotellaceae bacterium]
MANYEKKWSSANPGLLVIMLDQSSSMKEEYLDGESKAVFASKAVNSVIQAIIDKNFDGMTPKNRCFIAIFGYGTDALLLKNGYIGELMKSPIRVEQVTQKVNAGTGTLVDKPVNMSIWVEAEAKGVTNMTAAFRGVKDLIEGFINKTPDCPAPIVINISDGAPYIGGDEWDYSEAEKAAQSIMSLSCKDGNPLIFNAHIEKDSFNVKLPADKKELPQNDNAFFLFDISSVIPDAFKSAAEKNNLKVKENARGCMIGANAESLIKLIDFGSSKGLEDIKKI